MADGNVTSSAEHIAALDFDLTGIEGQFVKLGAMVQEQGQMLAQQFNKNAVFKVDMNLDGSEIQAQGKSLESELWKVIEEFGDKAGVGTMRISNEIEGDLKTILSEGFKAVMYVTEAQKKQLDDEIKGWKFGDKLKIVVEEDGNVIRNMLRSNGEMFDELDSHASDAYIRAIKNNSFSGEGPEDQMDYYKAQIKLLKQLQELRNGSEVNGERLQDNVATEKGISALEKLRDILNALTESHRMLQAAEEQTAQSQEKVNKAAENIPTVTEVGPEGTFSTYSIDEIKNIAENAKMSADEVSKIGTSFDYVSEKARITLNYTDDEGHSLKQVYESVGKVADGMESASIAFRKLNEGTTDNVTLRFNNQVKEAKTFENQLRVVKAMLEGVQTEAAKSGNIDLQNQAAAQLAEVNSIGQALQNNNKLQQNGAVVLRGVTQSEKDRLAAVIQTANAQVDVVKQEKLAKIEAEKAAKAKKEEQSTAARVATLYKEIVALEKQQNTTNGMDAGVAQSTAALKEQLKTRLQQITAEGQLAGVSKETLDGWNAQLKVLEAQTAAMREENGTSLLKDNADDGLLSRSGKWFGAYQVWHLIRGAITETASAVVDAEGQMAEISRVMNDATYNADEYRTSLYGLAEQYGQTFTDTAEIAAEWARAGYDVADSQLATKDTLLALATADLDASTATTDLIAVSQQWGLQLSDLEGMIDRVNIASDRYPVSAQNLMDALSKVGNTAKNAGMSMDETIASITAMSAATGTSGAAVGNALRSMISITNKPSNLNKLEGLGVDIYADKATGTLKNYYDIIKSIGTVWNASGEQGKAALEAQMAELGLVNEDIAGVIGQTENYTEHLTATTEDQRALTQAVANTYRSNYFQALLGNGGMADEVLDTLQEAAGYSQDEMTVWMETLQAHLNTLKTSLEELAVTSAENGLADFAKNCMDAANAVVQFTNKTGGLNTVMLALFDVAMLAKAEKINKVISAFTGAAGEAAKTVLTFGENFLSAQKAFGTASAIKGATMEIKNLGSAMLAAVGPAGWIAIAVTAFYALSTAIDKMQNSVKDARDALYKNASEAEAALGTPSTQDSGITSILQQYEQYHDSLEAGTLSEQEYVSKVGKLQQDLNALVGEQGKQIDLVNGKYGETQEAVEKLYGAQYAFVKMQKQEAADTAQGVLDDGVTFGASFFGGNNLGSDAMNNLKDKAGWFTKELENLVPKEGQTKLEAQLEHITEKMAQLEAAGQKGSAGYNAFEQAARDVNEQITAQREVLDSNEAFLSAYDDAVEDASDATDDAGNAAEQAGAYYDNLNSALQTAEEGASGLSSNLSSLESALADVNSGNDVSLSTMSSLLSTYPELASAIVEENGVLSLNAEALEKVRQAQYDKMVAEQVAAVCTAEGADWEATHGAKLAELTNNLYAAADATQRQAAQTALLNYITQNATGSTTELSAAMAQMKILFTQSNTAAENLAKGASGSSNASTAAATAAKEAAKVQTDAYKKEKDAADKAFDAQTKQVEAAKKAYDKQAEAHTKAVEAEKKAYDDAADARVKALEKEKKAAEDSYQSQIDELNKLKEANSRSDEGEDYDSERAELNAKLAEAEKRTGKDAVEEAADLRKQIADLDKDRNRTLRDEGIEDKISALEDEKDAASESYDSQIEAIKAAKEVQDEYYDNLKTQISEAKTAQDDYYDDQKTKISEAKSASAEYYQDLTDKANAAAETATTNATKTANAVTASGTTAAENTKLKIDEVAQKMVESMGGTTENYTSFLNGLSVLNQNFADLTMQQLEPMFKKYQELDEQMQKTLEMQNNSKLNAWSGSIWSQQTGMMNSNYNQFSGKFPSSHSGSTVTKEGLVNVAPGEIILDSMASQALSQIAEPMRQVFLQPGLAAGLKNLSARDSAIAAAGGAKGGSGTVVNYNVGQQTVNDNADADLLMAKFGQSVKKALV